LVTDRHANALRILPPSLGTLRTEGPIVDGAPVVALINCAAAVDHSVSLVASQTDSLRSVELAAKTGNFAAYPILVKIISLWALRALIFDPSLATVVIRDSDDVAEGDAGSCRVVAAEIAGEGAEREVSVHCGEQQKQCNRYQKPWHFIVY
jgi:hypothetical protein